MNLSSCLRTTALSVLLASPATVAETLQAPPRANPPLLQRDTILASVSILGAANDQIVYSGEWKSKTAKAQGPIKVAAMQTENDEWKVRFDGESGSNQFSYEVTFSSSVGKKGKTKLEGQASIAGELYQLSCWMNHSTFYVQFKSDVGSEGEFHLSRDMKKEERLRQG